MPPIRSEQKALNRERENPNEKKSYIILKKSATALKYRLKEHRGGPGRRSISKKERGSLAQ